MEVSVVLTARNEEKYIEGCLRQLASQTMRPEIIVVDGHSKDRTVSIAKRYADKVVEDNGVGIADARNVGWKHAKGKIVAYCDADSIPPLDWVENIYRLMDGNVCVFGPIAPYDGNRKVRFGLKVWGDIFLNVSSNFRYPCPCASNMAIKKSVLTKHPFRFRMLEDFDMGNRLRKIGRVKFYKSLCMPISARRFEKSFHRLAFRYYLLNYFRLKMGMEMKSYLAAPSAG